jgi:hypothetical protein
MERLEKMKKRRDYILISFIIISSLVSIVLLYKKYYLGLEISFIRTILPALTPFLSAGIMNGSVILYCKLVLFINNR